MRHYIKVIILSLFCMNFLNSCMSCDDSDRDSYVDDTSSSIDKGSIRRHAEYFYRQGEKYGTILRIDGELSEEDLYNVGKLEEEEREYINTLSSEEYDYFMQCVYELDAE